MAENVLPFPGVAGKKSGRKSVLARVPKWVPLVGTLKDLLDLQADGSRREFLKISGGVVGTLVGMSALGLACSESANIEGVPGVSMPVVDLTEGQDTVEKVPVIPPSLAVFIPVAGAAQYEAEYLDQFTNIGNPNYLGRQLQFTPHAGKYETWLQSTKVLDVTRSIMNSFLRGNPDFANSANWQILSPPTQVEAEHMSLLTRITQKGIDADQEIKIIGYYSDQLRTKESNIMKQVMMVEDTATGNRYIVKIQNANRALNETTSLTSLKSIDPEIKVIDATTAKLNMSSTNKLTVTISNVVRNSTAQNELTLADYLKNGNVLTDLQKTQLMQRYTAAIKGYMKPDNPFVLHADLLKDINIVVADSGDLVQVDAFADTRPVLVIDQGGRVKTSNPHINEHLKWMRQMLIEYGVDENRIALEEQNLLQQNASRLSVEIQPRTAHTVNVDDLGVVKEVVVDNQLDHSIVMPKSANIGLWNKVTTGLVVGGAVLAGIAITKEISEKILSTDKWVEALMGEAHPHYLRGLPADLHQNMYNNEHIYAKNLAGHRTFTIPVETMRTLVDRHDWWVEMFADPNVAQDKKKLQIRLQTVTLDPLDDLQVWVETKINQQGNPELYFSPRSPVIQKDTAGNPSLAVLGADSYNHDIRSITHEEFDQVSKALGSDLVAAKGEKWRTLEYLRMLQEGGTLAFWSLTASGYIAYGAKVGDTYEIRYLSVDDAELSAAHPEMGMYQDQYGQFVSVQKAVTIDELAAL